MADHHVLLPTSVDDLISKICLSQNQSPPDADLRRQLAALGEDQALLILRQIAQTTIIKTFSAFLKYMLNKATSPSPSPSRTRSHHHSLHTPQMLALAELEFRKAFLLLSYIGRQSLENVISDVNYIRNLKDMHMAMFEKRIWEDLGKHHIYSKSDRQVYLDWDSGQTHVYQCYVSSDGNIRFKGPILQSTQRHLLRSLGDDNVLEVKFAENENGKNLRTSVEEANKLYGKFGKEGIRVGLRLYRFFVALGVNTADDAVATLRYFFKDGGKEEKKKDSTSSSVKCYFVRMQSYSENDTADYILSNKTVSQARTLFMHAHTLPNLDKYMARFSLILSKTIKLNIDWDTVTVQPIEDLYGKDENDTTIYHNEKPHILTDGTGFISRDLALLCPNNVFHGRKSEKEYIQEINNLVESEKAMGEAEMKLSTHQPCRLYHMGCAIKGTLLVNTKLPPRTIHVRHSMIKVETDPTLSNVESINSMEKLDDMKLDDTLADLKSTCFSNKPNRTYLSKYLIALLSYGGVPNEFFMDLLGSNLEDTEHVYSNKRVALRASINYGEMDEYNAAEMILCGIPLDEPFLRENGQITGDVLVYRNPGLHFGDIHIMHAKYVEELESYVGHSKKSDPWKENSVPCNSVGLNSSVKRPSAFTAEELEEELFRLFLEARFQPRYSSNQYRSGAADSWMALMDRLLTLKSDCTKENEKEHVKENILKLIDIYYEALDAPKKGGRKVIYSLVVSTRDHKGLMPLEIQVPKDLTAEMFPHYMERDKSFTSTSILGLIYDEVGKWQTRDLSRQEIKMLPCFDVKVPTSYMEKWEPLYEQYRKDMKNAVRGNSIDKEEAAEVIRKYKEKLYDAAKMEDSPKNISDIYYEALAVYRLSYEYAIKTSTVSRCGFAWKVAGPALTRLYNIKQNQKLMNCAPSALREIFGS
ncbi:hypothetical protein Fmac_030293 [Flemingia macrophylla]|uniref:RNA-dependent RNA polymerase n=1 Tax=Flemingia macrophylla TaxID=520843 RepID=A0ABD1LCS4_9FABA